MLVMLYIWGVYSKTTTVVYFPVAKHLVVKGHGNGMCVIKIALKLQGNDVLRV